FPMTIARIEPASAAERAASDFCALRMTVNSGANAQKNMAQNASAYGHTNGSGRIIDAASKLTEAAAAQLTLCLSQARPASRLPAVQATRRLHPSAQMHQVQRASARAPSADRTAAAGNTEAC